MTRPKLLDLFCGATQLVYGEEVMPYASGPATIVGSVLWRLTGGAAMGYHRAGFDVTGWDIAPQKHYPFEFHQGDAMEVLQDTAYLRTFDFIHASPPCQHYSRLHSRWKDRTYPDLLGAVRDGLTAAGVPWVIENVEGAPMRPRLFLCGRMFDLALYRHRLFESSFSISQPWHPRVYHALRANGTKGTAEQRNSAPIKTICGHNTRADVAREVMGMPWATRAEVSQAIPPAYTEYIGRAWLALQQAA